MRTFFLDMSGNAFGEGYIRPKGATWNKRLRLYTYEGLSLPEELLPYKSNDYSLLRWREDQYNRKVLRVNPYEHRFTPRPHQKEAAIAIATSAKKGYRGFVEGDGTGIGKTLASIYGVYGASKALGQKSIKLLIICPKAAISQWTDTLKAFPMPHARICIVNYEQSLKLLKEPASAKNVKKSSTKKQHTISKGEPTVDWDYIIADESQKLKNWETSQRAKAFGRIAKYHESAKKAPFVIWASATIGQNPLELRYLFPLMKQVTKDSERMSWFDWLNKYNFNVRLTQKTNNVVLDNKDEKTNPRAFAQRTKSDLNKLNKILFSPASPSIRRTPVDIAGWPEIQRIAQGSTLTPMEYVQYTKEWLLFRQERSLFLRGKNPVDARTRALRFRQKSSLIRIPYTVSHIEDLFDSGMKVAVFCEFMENVDEIRTKLEKTGLRVAEFTGRNEDTRESERIKFQKGEKDVIIFSVDSAVSFHAGEILKDGTKAIDTPRATVMHDLPYSGIKATQIEGRCHRDGTFAPVYYMYATNTTENGVAKTMVGRIKSIINIMDDESFADELDNILSGNGTYQD